VASFEKGVLTLMLTNGSMVSGTVTAATKIICATATPVAKTAGDDVEREAGREDGGGQQGREDENSGSRTPPPTTTEKTLPGEDQGGPEQDDQDEQGTAEGTKNCSMSALLPGAAVGEAVLRIDATGTTFVTIKLIG
jgi:hypothetical protein